MVQPIDNCSDARGNSVLSAGKTINYGCTSKGKYVPLTMDVLHQHDVQMQRMPGYFTGTSDQLGPHSVFGIDLVAPALDSPYTVPVEVSNGHYQTSKRVSGTCPPQTIASQHSPYIQYRRSASSYKHDWQQSSDTMHEDHNPDDDLIRYDSMGGRSARDSPQDRSMFMDRGGSSFGMGSSTTGSTQELTAWGNDLAGIGNHLDDYGCPEYADNDELIVD
jgi:hypothetical protein